MDTKILIPKNSRLRQKTTGFSFFYYICLFLFLSFLGWLWEVSLCLLTQHAFVNRGVLFGPWLPIYGAGGIFLYFLLYPMKKHPVGVFFLAAFLCLALEYFSSWFLEKLWGIRWWDYSQYWGNINGRICPLGGLLFGTGALLAVYVLIPWFERRYEKIPSGIRKIAGILLLLLFVADAAYAAATPNTGDGISSASFGSVHGIEKTDTSCYSVEKKI